MSHAMSKVSKQGVEVGLYTRQAILVHSLINEYFPLMNIEVPSWTLNLM